LSIGPYDYVEDRIALEVIAKAVMAETIASMGRDQNHVRQRRRVQKAKANTLQREFDALKFCDSKSVDDFGIRINKIAHQLKVPNNACTDRGGDRPQVSL